MIVDLEDSIALDRKDAARASAAAFLKKAVTQAKRPRLLVRVNGLATGLTDADLDAIVPAKPDAILLPKAEGGASVIHADAKLTAREAIAGIDDGHIKILAQATETAAGDVPRRHLQRRERPPDRHDLGAGGSVGRARRRGQPRRATAGSPSPISSRAALCLFGAAAAADRGDRDGLCRLPQRRRAAPRNRGGAPRRLHRQIAIHPAQVAVINEVFTPTAEAIAKRARRSSRRSRRSPAPARSRIDGVMYDRPHLARAKQLLARAGEASLTRLFLAVDRRRIERLVGVAEFQRRPRRPCRAAPRGRSTSAGRCGRRPARAARP